MRHETLLMLVVGLVGANSLALAPISATVGAALDRAATEVMWASAGFGLATALSAVFLAPLIDRIGAGRMARAAMALLALGLGLSAAAPSLGWLMVGQVLAGCASGVALPSAYSLAADIAPPGKAAATLGRVLTGWTLAIVFGVTLSAILSDLLHWRAVFASTAIGSGLLLMALRGLPNRTSDRITLPWSALPQPGVARGLLVQLLQMMSFYGTYSFLGAHLEVTGWSTLQGALPVLAYGVGFGLTGALDPWLDRRGYAGAGPLVFSGVGLSLLAISLTDSSLIGLTVAFFGWGLANHLALGLTVGRLTAAGGSQRGAVLGLNSGVTYLSVLCGAAGFAPLFTWGGLAACALCCALCAFVLAAEAVTQRGSRRVAPG